MSNEIIWTYEATAARVKSKNFIRYIIGAGLHAAGLAYVAVVYSDYIANHVLNQKLTITFVAVYAIELAVWYLFLNNLLKFKEKRYVLSETGMDITETATSKSKSYAWGQFTSFSLDPRVYVDGMQPPSEHDDYIFLGKKTMLERYMVIFVEPSIKAAVLNFLKARLEEKTFIK
ncbi:hypothetical protein HGA64_01490 [Candidatus Falkowbacteria bacterium]|nr:hypothetical protein [Candidatus Falkowbacteria bacterium]